MEFQDVVRRRRMVRNFDSRPVPPDVRDQILENAVRAPSAGFSQGWGFLVLEDEADRRKLFEALDAAHHRPPESNAWPGIRNAPLIILPLSHKQAYLDRYAAPDKGWTDRSEAHWPAPYWDIDTGFASLLMLLTAVDRGLGALFFGIFPPVEGTRAVKDAFGIPEAYHPIGIVAIGYALPDVKSPSLARGKRGVDEVVHFGHW